MKAHTHTKNVFSLSFFLLRWQFGLDLHSNGHLQWVYYKNNSRHTEEQRQKKKILSLSVTTNITVMFIPVADGDSLMMKTNLVWPAKDSLVCFPPKKKHITDDDRVFGSF